MNNQIVELEKLEKELKEMHKLLKTNVSHVFDYTQSLRHITSRHIEEFHSYYNMGNLFRKQGKINEALILYREAKEVIPDFSSLQKLKQKIMIYERLTLGPNGPLPFINDDKKFIMFWMPRCGYSTSVYWFFGTLGLHNEINKMYPALGLGERVHRYVGSWGKDYYKDLFSNTQRLQEFIETLINPDYYKFVIIRNPYSRLVSLFCALRHNPQLFEMLVPDKNPQVTFSQFVDNLSHFNLYSCDLHLRYQTANVCWSEEFVLDSIIDLAQLELGLKKINDKFALNVPISSLNVANKIPLNENVCYADHCFDDLLKIIKKKGNPNYKSFYTPELKEKVYKLFDVDIDKLGYSFYGRSTPLASSKNH